MKILVYGAGAIGGYLGGRLFQYGHDITLLSLPEAITPINEHGLTITEADKTVTLHPKTAGSLQAAFADNELYDLILVTMKSYDLDAAREAITPYLTATTPYFFTVGNGIGVERPFIDQFGAEHVIAGSLTTPVSKANNHHLIIERPDRGIGVAATSMGADNTRWVNLFQKAGVPAIGVADYTSMKWSKAFLNIVGNATAAILNCPPGDVYAMPGMFDLEVKMLRETAVVMQHKNLQFIDLPGSPARQLAFGVQRVPQFLLKPILTRIVAKGRGNKMPSFQIDLASGCGKSEVIYHNGAIAQTGQAVGVPAPVNATLNKVLMEITVGETAWESYMGQPQRLLSAVPK